MAADQDLEPAAAPPIQLGTQPRGVVHLVAISHLDTQWRWTIRDTIRRHLPKTLRENFAAFREHPHYVVSFDGAFRYRLIQEYYPREFAELRRWVSAGRFAPVGSMWDAADVNLPSPESLIRQVMLGRLWFRRELGVEVRDLFLPDCFGFGWAWPSIAAHCGAIGFSSQKLSKDRSAVPIPFPLGVWLGPDGAGLPCALNPGGYGEPLAGDPRRDPEALRQLAENARAGVHRVLRYFGIGDTGGAPDRRSLRRLDEAVSSGGTLRVECAPAGAIFEALSDPELAALPRTQGELLLSLHATGCYSSQAAMKRWNRRNEQLADAAERAAVAADWLGAMPYPRARLREAWQRFLWHQFHDDLTGTSIPAAYRYSWNDELLSLSQFGETLRAAVGAVSRGLDTRVVGRAVVVFNPLSIARHDLVELLLPAAEALANGGRARVVGPRGEISPAQVEPAADGMARVLFEARVAAHGVAVFDLQLGEEAPADGVAVARENELENANLRAAIDPNGDLASLFDRLAARETLRSPARWELLRDTSLRFPAWEIHYRDVMAEPLHRLGAGARLRVEERGPVRVTLAAERVLAGSRFVTRYRLTSGGDWLEVDCEIDWRSRGRLLKATFPAALREPTATYDLGLGTIEREVNHPRAYEVPAQQWADLSSASDGAGLAILNDSRHGWDRPDPATLRLTLLHTPRVGRRFRPQGRQDLGHHRLLYALAPHRGSWREGQVTQRAARLNQPLRAFLAAPHAGELGREFSLLVPSLPGVAVKAMKMAEESDEIVVRLQEVAGAPARVAFADGERIAAAREIDGAEGPLAPLSNGELTARGAGLALRAYEPRALALRLGPPPIKLAPPRSTPLELPFDCDVVSRDERRRDGAFDRRGRTLPGELLPGELVVHGVRFVLGSSQPGDRNALRFRGQVLALPPGQGRRLYALAAAAGQSRRVTLELGTARVDWEVEDWLGFYGDAGGPRRCGDVAWVGTHHHTRWGDEAYAFCYLYQYRCEIADQVAELRLPSVRGARGVRIMALTLTENPNPELQPAGVAYH